MHAIALLTILFAGLAIGFELQEPKLQILNLHPIVVEQSTPLKLSFKNQNKETEQLRLQQQKINDNLIYMNKKKMDTQDGAIVHYLLSLADKEGYQSRTGSYIFDNVYPKRPYDYYRYRRHILHPEDIEH